MTIKKFISKVRGVLLRRLEPLKYASKIGVNFPRGAPPIWESYLEHRTLAHHAWG